MKWLWEHIIRPAIGWAAKALEAAFTWMWAHPTATIVIGLGLYAVSWLVGEEIPWLSSLLADLGSIAITTGFAALAYSWLPSGENIVTNLGAGFGGGPFGIGATQPPAGNPPNSFNTGWLDAILDQVGGPYP